MSIAHQILAARAGWRRAINGTREADRARDLAAFHRIVDTELEDLNAQSTAAQLAAIAELEQHDADLRAAGQVLDDARRQHAFQADVEQLRTRNRQTPRPPRDFIDTPVRDVVDFVHLHGAALATGDTP